MSSELTVDEIRKTPESVQALEARARRLKTQTEDIPWTITNAITKGNWVTKISMLIMGFGNIFYGQFVKGLLWLFAQLSLIYYTVTKGILDIQLLPSLGWKEQGEVFNEDLGIFEYTQGHNSVTILLWGIIGIVVIITLILVWKSAVESAYKAEYIHKQGFESATFKEDLASLFDQRIKDLLLALPLTGVLAFSILPLLFMIAMAFTSYSKEGGKLTLFDWVAFDNFKRVLNLGNSIGDTFWPVLSWTMVWAVAATVLNFILGILLALLINRKRTRFKSMWRVIFSLTIAVPQFVSLLIINKMLANNGPINLLLQELNWIDSPLPFLTNTHWARFTVIIVNLWVGIPYTLLQVTGILQNFPEEYREAARIDGANEAQTFRHITMPYIISIMGPFLITQFTGNVNNFNVIYLLSGGGPIKFGSTAGDTDLLVTWLYKLTVDQQYYNIGAVIGIFTFLVLATVALSLYRITPTARSERGETYG